jgi:DNA-binding HxlR family transcriptional regulator
MDECPPFAADCGVRLATGLLAHQWDPVVLMALRAGPRRRLDLLADVRGISDKVLYESLRRLTGSGLLARVADGRAVAYELTGLGASLADGPLLELGRWAERHLDELPL